MKRPIILLAIASAAACTPAAPPHTQQEAPAEQSASARLGALAIESAWASATPGGARVAGAYLTIINTGAAADALLSASSPRAERVEIHETVVQDDIARMQRIDRLAIPAHGALAMAPGGMHVMFVNINSAFIENQRAQLTLRFQNAGDVTIDLPVRGHGAQAGADAHAGHAH